MVVIYFGGDLTVNLAAKEPSRTYFETAVIFFVPFLGPDIFFLRKRSPIWRTFREQKC